MSSAPLSRHTHRSELLPHRRARRDHRNAAQPLSSVRLRGIAGGQAHSSRVDDVIALLSGALVAVAVFLAVLAAAPAAAAGRKPVQASVPANMPAQTMPAQITLHRCVLADGGVTWQDHACPAGARSVTQRRYALPQPPAVQAKAARTAPRTSVRNTPPARAAKPARNTPDACTQARRAREQARESAGLRADYALIERTDRAVWMACRGS